MPVSKLKNLAILILLLANMALLCLLVPRQYSQHNRQQELERSLTDLCAAQNVVLAPNCVPQTLSLYTLELTDSDLAEDEILTRLLGQAPVRQDRQLQTQSGEKLGSWENGTINLRLQGRREVSDFRASTRRLLKKLDFQIWALGSPVRLSPGIFTVTAQQSVLGVPVYSRGLTLTYDNSALEKLEGDFFSGTLTRTDDTVCCSAAEAVVSFLSERVELGWVGSTIKGLQQGYLPAEAAGSALRLVPVWLLSTDTGSFYVNALTGTVTQIS